MFPSDCIKLIFNSSQKTARFKASGIEKATPASTGSDNNNNTAVTTTAHPNNASLCNLIPGLLILSTVVMTSQ